MKKLLACIIFFSLISACTSEVETAKKLGFQSPGQMNYLTELGYKNYEDFKSAHPYQINSDSSKFAESEIGGNAIYFGLKKEGEYGDYYANSSNVSMWVDNENKVSVISLRCSDEKSSSASIDGVNCKSNETEIQKFTNGAIEYCVYEDESRSIYLKNNGFIEINQANASVISLGIAKSIQAIYFPSNYYDKCNVVIANTNASKAAGFEAVSDFLEAKKVGIKTAYEWKIEQAKKKFKEKYASASNALEKSLIFLVSTPQDFQAHKDDGGLNVFDSWRGYKMSTAEVEYKSKILTLFHVIVRSDYANDKKPASFNNLKRDLIDECGSKWDSHGRDDVYWSESEFSSCEISEARQGGYHVIVSVKTKKED